MYPVQHEDGKVLVNVAAFVGNPSMENTPYSEAPSSASCTQEEIFTAYAGWEPEVQALLQVRIIWCDRCHMSYDLCFSTQCLSQPKKWPIGDLIPLDSYASDRIFVGGDAVRVYMFFVFVLIS